MPNTDFFNKEETVDEQPTNDTQTFKLGEKEYSQEELTRLVGLGEIGDEAENKYGVKLDKVWPNLNRTINEKIALEQQLKSFEEERSRPTSHEQIDERQLAEQARAKLAELGYVGRDEVQRMVNDTIAGLRLTEDAQKVINNMTEQGYPKTNLEDLLNFMADPSNPKDPTKAYKVMFETEIDKVKEQKLATLKPSAFITQGQSTAGSKAPAPQKVTSKNLYDAIAAALPD